MLKKLLHTILELHTSDFSFVRASQTQLCISDSLSHNCVWPGAVNE